MQINDLKSLIETIDEIKSLFLIGLRSQLTDEQNNMLKSLYSEGINTTNIDKAIDLCLRTLKKQNRTVRPLIVEFK